jgi:hypothetical protein
MTSTKKAPFPLFILIGFIALWAVACETTAPATSAPAESEYSNVFIDAKLRGQLVVDDLTTGFTPGELMTAQINLASRSRKEIVVAAKFEWIDEYGQTIPSPTSRFIRQTAYPGQPLNLRSIAPSTQAADFRLLIKPE